MKKLLLIFTLLFIFIACRQDSENTENYGSSTRINPPAWIQGKWALDSDYYYTFTKNDIIIQVGGMTTNIKPIADLGGYSQTSSDTEFSFSFHLFNQIQTYRFKKISSTKIIYDLGLGMEDEDMWMELTKQ